MNVTVDWKYRCGLVERHYGLEMPLWAWSTSPWTGNCRCGHACGIRVVFNIAIRDIGGLKHSSSVLADELADQLAYELVDEHCRCRLNGAAVGNVA